MNASHTLKHRTTRWLRVPAKKKKTVTISSASDAAFHLNPCFTHSSHELVRSVQVLFEPLLTFAHRLLPRHQLTDLPPVREALGLLSRALLFIDLVRQASGPSHL